MTFASKLPSFTLLSRRAYATTATPHSPRPYIPPFVASLPHLNNNVGQETAVTTEAASMPSLVKFYRNLPKGPAPAITIEPTDSFLERYSKRHFSRGSESAKPVLHAILLVAGVGYTMLYIQHFGEHKSRKYH